MILAYAGVERLGMGERISQLIPTDCSFRPLDKDQLRSRYGKMTRMLLLLFLAWMTLRHEQCVMAERALLRKLEGGCQVPIGGYATVEDETLTLDGIVGSLDGKTIFRETRSGQASEPEQLGEYVAQALLDQGADAVLSESRAAAN